MSQATTREEVPRSMTAEEIQRLVAERKQAGAVRTQVVAEHGRLYIITDWPAL